MLATSRVIGHKEWAPGRKSDPRYDMNMRRAQVAAFTPAEDDMPSFDDPIEWNLPGNGQKVKFTFAQWIVWTNWYASQAATSAAAAATQLAGLTAAVDKLADAVAAGRDDLTADELRQAVSGAIQDAGAALRVAQATAGPAQ